jgi:hypothetical protein
VKTRTVVVRAAACSAASSSSVALASRRLALELGDPELLRGDQRQVFRGFRPRDRQFRHDLEAPRALGDQRGFQGGDVVGKSLGSRIHATQRITVRVI